MIEAFVIINKKAILISIGIAVSVPSQSFLDWWPIDIETKLFLAQAIQYLLIGKASVQNVAHFSKILAPSHFMLGQQVWSSEHITSKKFAIALWRQFL